MTKVDIISGFLGAGKTTFINKLINESLPNERVLLIENEFGEIGIDSGFLKDTGIQVKEMNSGCICCSIANEFKSALKDVLEKYKPERVIIEPSGVGKLSDVIRAVESVKEHSDISLNSFVTVVDSIKYKLYMDNFAEFFSDQIKNAETIILSRSQKLAYNEIDKCVNEIRELNNKANIITTPWENLNGKQILNIIEKINPLEQELLNQIRLEKHECHCHNRNHNSDVFSTWGIKTTKKYRISEIDNILRKLSHSDEYGEILRAKGIVQDVEGNWINFNLVPEEYELHYGNTDNIGRLCVIGSKLNSNNLEKIFS